jgi:hypothetical protein
MNGADLRSAIAGNVKKINNLVDSTQTQWRKQIFAYSCIYS